MPAADKLDLDKTTDDRDTDNEKSHSTRPKSSSSKSKDLSHVPCKFFKVGACTAGSSCPFSHIIHEPGQHKDVCAWFVKGNCKFGHKCALAHVLPGQNLSMDRKNKKAAQLAANGGVPSIGRESKSTKGPKKDGHKSAPHGTSSTGTGLLSGSTAPTRTTSARPPMVMTLKATPSAPAPPVKDTDFPPFVLPDDVDTHKPNNAPPTTATTESTSSTKDEETPSEPPLDSSSRLHHRIPSPPTLPLNVPRRAILPPVTADLGPIGSPPRGSLSTHSPISSGNSPQNAGIPSTFHAQTSLLTESRNRLGAAAGVPSSLGHTHTQAWKTDLGSGPAQGIIPKPSPGIDVSVSAHRDVLSADEDLEEFLPSSLTDLLTPSERSRRMSRTHSGSARPVNLNDTPSLVPPSQTHANHRYSRSVPAPSLLGDVKSIWAERGLTTNGVPASPDKPSFGAGPIGLGTPSSLKSSNGLGALNLGGTITPSGTGISAFRDDSHSPSSSLLAPSNASAAFLPGLHQYYSKMNPGNNNGRGPNAGLALGAGLGLGGLSRSPLTHAPIHGPPADEGRTPNNGASIGLGLGEATSPSFRALQSHAPGQSLPQGLAAGYSRIHAIPLTGSPSSLGGSSVGGGTFSPGHGPVPFGINAGSGQDWHLQSNHALLSPDAISVSHLSLSAHHDLLGAGANPMSSSASATGAGASISPSMAALESMFSRFPPTGGPPLRTPPHVAANSHRQWLTQNVHSPLSRPIGASDDDELFSMDG
ncbi:hypothetical protein L210DRAFT_3545344 [Boletus edulis BED1]|uniref:C3H1-type domain-containing protein n=1 Tax=Boletus edulis BED1 TaxID=1328754 RepID=A0AAD4GDJ5_BOLED|nr:hypothetical protein L210DRAFT_3545344 [Boletus edulis BED1]